MPDSVEAAEVDPSSDNEEGIEDVGSAVPGEAKQKSTRSKEGSMSACKWQEPQRKEAAGDVIRSDDRCPLAGGSVKTSKVGVGTACDVQNTGAAEASDLKDAMSIHPFHDVCT